MPIISKLTLDMSNLNLEVDFQTSCLRVPDAAKEQQEYEREQKQQQQRHQNPLGSWNSNPNIANKTMDNKGNSSMSVNDSEKTVSSSIPNADFLYVPPGPLTGTSSPYSFGGSATDSKTNQQHSNEMDSLQDSEHSNIERFQVPASSILNAAIQKQKAPVKVSPDFFSSRRCV